MKKAWLILPLTLTLTSCNLFKKDADNIVLIEPGTISRYGAFLGRSEDNITNFENYDDISLEIDEFSDATISKLNKQNKHLFSYLNVGSLEEYRSYYDTFKHLIFESYENWDDEGWIDVRDTSWQNYVTNTLASHMKSKGAYGVYLDNVDVYSVIKESNEKQASGYKSALKNIIKGVSNQGLKVMVNGGAEFFDDLIDDKDNEVFNYVYAYHQEEVFSLIKDYDKNIFGKQDNEDSTYYKSIAKQFKDMKKEVYLLEYTKDESLKKQIKDYCDSKGYHYYVSSRIELD